MYSTDDLVQRAVQALRKMQKVEAGKVSFTTAELSVTNTGVEAHAVAAKTETVQYRGSLPDILAYLQNETELTRSTLVRILKESGRLSEFFVNPQRSMDSKNLIPVRKYLRLEVPLSDRREHLPLRSSFARQRSAC